MFCRKCGDIIEDGEELCQACRQQDSSVGEIIKQKLEEMGKILKETGNEALKEAKKEVEKNVEKNVQKKTKQVVRKFMVKTGLKKETPLDKAKNMRKKIKR